MTTRNVSSTTRIGTAHATTNADIATVAIRTGYAAIIAAQALGSRRAPYLDRGHLMSLSTIDVVSNAQLLRRHDLTPDTIIGTVVSDSTTDARPRHDLVQGR